MYPLLQPADLERARRALHPAMHAADWGMRECSQLFPTDAQAFQAFLASWDAYYASPVASAQEEIQAIRTYARGLMAWQGVLRERCHRAEHAYRVGAVGVCANPFGCVITSSDVKQAKATVNAEFISVNRAIHACAGQGKIPNEEMQSWLAFKTSWDDLFQIDEGFFTAVSEMNTVQDYERNLADWQKRIKQRGCDTFGPNIVPPPPPGSQDSGIQSTIKTVAIAAALIMGGSLLLNVLPRR